MVDQNCRSDISVIGHASCQRLFQFRPGIIRFRGGECIAVASLVDDAGKRRLNRWFQPASTAPSGAAAVRASYSRVAASPIKRVTSVIDSAPAGTQ